MDEIKAREACLDDRLRSMESLLIGFSGGTDSTYLLARAHRALGSRVLAVTAVSPLHPEPEIQDARRIAAALGVEHMVMETRELDDPRVFNNPADRCYHCKRILFTAMITLAKERNIQIVADGTNRDDESDLRPGMRALAELQVRSPLREAGLTKSDIRRLSREMGLPGWNKPARACLASRIVCGVPLTRDRLRRIEKAEAFFIQNGLIHVRVRDHHGLARIELSEKDMEQALSPGFRRRIAEVLRELGFAYITLDLEGYRTGSLQLGEDHG